jgi:hypothetical protein
MIERRFGTEYGPALQRGDKGACIIVGFEAKIDRLGGVAYGWMKIYETLPSGSTIRRILIAQSLYAFGALLCIFNTYWSIGFIVLVQLNYAIAPRFRPLSQI